jgi:hypothetical protein
MDWCPGTFYVALSRATNLNNVVLSNYSGKYKCSGTARDFYANNYTADSSDVTDTKSQFDDLLGDISKNSKKRIRTNAQKQKQLQLQF